jgi:hypothetical protein
MEGAKTYEGTKRLKAVPMTRGDYNAFRGWQQPADEDPEEAGYMVEYLDGGKPNVEGFDGYVSWSPADVFERSYKEIGIASESDDRTANNGVRHQSARRRQGRARGRARPNQDARGRHVGR